jgi:hypothetical protein
MAIATFRTNAITSLAPTARGTAAPHAKIRRYGRRGRVLDHYVVWVTLGLRSDSLETSPSLEYFPTEHHEEEYYEGLLEADLHRPERIRAFYLERLLALLDDN